jgi:glycosyltransferase involved in cell wall biosynthesis
MIKIAHCLERVHSGGVERRRLSLARKLPRDRFRQLLICTEASHEISALFQEAGCEVLPLGPMVRGFGLRAAVSAAKALRKFEPDIVHGAVYEGVIMAAVGGRLANVPIIVGEETADPKGRSWRGHVYYRLLCSLCHEVVAVSDVVATYLTRTLRVPRSKVRVIKNGVAEPEAATATELAAVRSQFGLTGNSIVIGTVGRLTSPRNHPPDSHKRIVDAIRAVKLLIREFPEVKLLVVGDGSDREWLEARAAQECVKDSVVFAGYHTRTRPYFECMDILVHPAASEAFGLVLVEAMFAQRPVVATNVGGIPEIVQDGQTGFLVPPYRPDIIAERIIQLLGDPALRARMGAAGLKRAREQFSEDRYVGDVAELYEELVAKLQECG